MGVFSRIKESESLYLLVEHMRTSSPHMPFRTASYSFNTISQHRKAEKTRGLMPLVFCIVVYNAESPYVYAGDLWEFFKPDKELARSIFSKSFELIDLTQISDKDLQRKKSTSILLRSLEEVLSWIETIIPVFELIRNEDRRDLLYSTILYQVCATQVM